MAKQTQLRLRNITSKAPLKYGSENDFKAKRHRIFQAAQTKFIRNIFGMTIKSTVHPCTGTEVR